MNTTNNYNSDEILQLCRQIIRFARTGDYGNTASYLNQFLGRLQTFLLNPQLSESSLHKITYSLETLMAMQETKNWVAFADVLEYELIALLQEAAKSMRN